mgnify:CR=1 FL=1
MHNYRELKIWQKSIELTQSVYQLTFDLPSNEKFGLVSQLQRASVSVASNIAEGSSRDSQKEFNYFLSLAIGSLFEIDTQIVIAKSLGFIKEKESDKILNQVLELIKMTRGFQKTIKSNSLASKI